MEETILSTENKMVKEYYENTQSNVIKITEDKLRLILIENKGALNEKKDYIGPLILMITILLIFCTTEFKFDHSISVFDFKNNMILYLGFLFIALFKSIQWFYSALKNSIKVVSIDDLIFKVRNQEIESKESKNVFVLLWIRMISMIGFDNIRINVPKVKIYSARYGSGSKWKDVTENLKKQIADNKLDVIAANDIWGDPIPGTPKQLEIDLTINGKRKKMIIPEGVTEKIS
jgi:hypothetical protein